MVFDLILKWEMRRGNLTDGGHDKVTRKRGSNVLKRRHDNETLRLLGDLPQQR